MARKRRIDCLPLLAASVADKMLSKICVLAAWLFCIPPRETTFGPWISFSFDAIYLFERMRRKRKLSHEQLHP